MTWRILNKLLLITFFYGCFFQIHGQSANQNYIKKAEFLEPATVDDVNNNYHSLEKIESVTYLDGFGNAKQTVAVKQSPQKKDLVQHIEYDQFGRNTRQYLILPSSQNNGNYVANASSEIVSYYQESFGDQRPFTEIVYENSPLNRKSKTAAPGELWQAVENSETDHTTKYSNSVNGAGEVLRLDIDETNSEFPLVSSFYLPGELLKNTVRNENWVPADDRMNTRDIFSDKNGRTIAEFTYESNDVFTTYYVYDDIGNLRYVLPPKIFDDDNTINVDNFQEQWFINDFLQTGNALLSKITFDITDNVLTLKSGRQKLSLAVNVLANQTIKILNTSSPLPDMYLGVVNAASGLIGPDGPVVYQIGTASIENGNLVINRTSSDAFSRLLIDIEIDLDNIPFNESALSDLAFQYKYDKYNRQIEQKAPGIGWEYMVYDRLDRPILTQDANFRSQGKWLFTAYDMLDRVVYSGIHENSLDRAALQLQVDAFIASNPTNRNNVESRKSTPSNIGGVNINYTNEAFPTTNLEILNVNYYDDYSFTDGDLPTLPSSVLGQEVTGRTRGLTTSVWSKTIGESSWSKVYSFYDKRGRTILLYEKNHLGGYTQTQSKLDFRGKVEKSITLHKRLNSDDDIIIAERFEYDHAERPKKHYQKINNQAEELIALNNYNELGLLESKSIGGKTASDPTNFTDITNLSIHGNKIKKVAGGNSWNAGLASEKIVYGDGYVEFSPTQNNKNVMVGLSTTNTNANYNTINYAIYAQWEQKVIVYENGVFKGNHATYEAGDILRVERVGTTIYYKKNNEVIYTSTVASTGNLIADISVYHGNTVIENLAVQASYKDMVGVETNYDTNTITKISGGGWNAGFASVKSIHGNGSINYRLGFANKAIVVGLSTSNDDLHYNSIDYAIYAVSNGQVRVHESGINRGVMTTYEPNDSFSIERKGSTIYYSKNGEVFYTSTIASYGNLIGDVSMYHTGGVIYNLEIGNEEAGLQTINYTRNIRGWLTHINDVNELGNDLFSYQMNYTYTEGGNFGNNPYYNGNIAQVIWSSVIDNTKKSYFFQYDKLNRLAYSRYGEGQNLTDNWQKYLSSVAGYDSNGNILGIYRRGITSSGSVGNVDGLVYTYDDGNKLQSVKDDFGDPNAGFIEATSATVDYDYDRNGNLIFDANKKIDLIEYNHLDLVEKVTFNNGNTIEFAYSSKGEKLQMKTTEGSTVMTVDYLGGFQYINAEMQFFATPEGFAKVNGSTFDYVYVFKDHVGSSRLGFSDLDGDYQQVLDSNFNEDRDSWWHNGNVTSELVNGRLKVFVDGAWEGVKNELAGLSTEPGDVINVSLKFDKGDTQANVRLYFQELDADGNHLSWNLLNGNLSTGSHEYAYTVNAANRLRLRIDKQNTHLGDLTHFFIDHVSVSKGDLEIISNTDYYPMGMAHYGELITYSRYTYKFQAKEQLSAFGFNMYDFGSRMYDPSVGRWFNGDPQNQFWSPYVAMGNNHVMMVDPHGEFSWLIGALIGGAVNTLANWARGNINGWDDFALSFLGGGASAYASGYNSIGSLVSGTLYNQFSSIASGDTGVSFGFSRSVVLNFIKEPSKILNAPMAAKLYLAKKLDGTVAGDVLNFGIGFENGFGEAVIDTGEFIGGLFTGESWVSIYDGIVYSAKHSLTYSPGGGFNPYFIATDEKFREQNNAMYESMRDLENRWVNGSWRDRGFIVGYATEKVGEGFVLKRLPLPKINLRGGPTFSQYKYQFWKNNPQINRSIEILHGPDGQYFKNFMELHHRYIPQRWQKRFRLPNWLINNKFNLKPMRSLDHGLVDPYRYQFFPKWLKNEYPF
ncbi:DUF6443 domain-containing protein [Aureisphaera galaxeae]|uniref:DUF6443 domain-containing protein n=1 Tax=Aureisphaera galaxeae TaxID=1538023 RepID=UPI002350FDD3|nr:DUF6443 domain-containing protein [Aureisphaera galaxeae]MDC8002582.1 DUF6443 domain-containing protein [Aureisphaera galaxeae]